MQSIQRQAQDMPMTSWFDVPYATLAEVYKSDEVFEICVFAVFFFSLFAWRALKGESAGAILKSLSHKGSKRVNKSAKCVDVADGEVDVPDEPSKSTTGEAVSKTVPNKSPWRAASLAKMQPSCAKTSNPRRAHSEHHGSPSSVSEEAQQLAGMVAEQYTKALRQYRELVRTGKDAQIRDDDFYFAFLQASVRVGHADVVRSLLEAMSRNQVAPSVCFCRSVLKLLASKHMHAECVYMCDLFGEKMPIDRVVNSCAAFSFLERGSPLRATECLDKLHAVDQDVTSREYSSFFRYYAATNDCERAAELLQTLLDKKIPVESVSVNRVLNAFVEARKLSEATRLTASLERLDAIRPTGLGGGSSLDIVTYNTLLKGYAQAHNTAKCFEVLERLTARGLQPDDVTYGILIEACISDNDLCRATQVIEIVTKSGCKLNTVLFTTFMKGFVRNGRLDRAMALYETMRRSMAAEAAQAAAQGEHDEPSARPDLIMYSILIRANCEHRNLEVALRLLSDMTKEKIFPDNVLLNHLLEGCCYTSNAQLGQQLFDDIRARFHVQPSHFTLSTMVKLYGKCGLCDVAEKFVDSLEAEFGQKPTVVTYTCFMSGCIRHGKLEKAWRAYQRMQDVFGLQPDKMVFSTLTAAFVQDATRLRQLAEDARKLGLSGIAGAPEPWGPSYPRGLRSQLAPSMTSQHVRSSEWLARS